MFAMMSWIDFLGVGVLAVFLIVGALRGFLAGVLGVINLVLAYATAFFAATTLAAPLPERSQLHPILAGALAGTVAFLGAMALLASISALFLRRHRRRNEGKRSGLDTLGGALIGGLQGCLIAVLLYWMAGQLQASGILGEPETEPGLMSRVSQQVVRSGADAVLSDEGTGRLMAQLVADPVGTSNELQDVLDSPAIGSLQQDELFWQYLSSGAVDSALNRGTFLRVSNDAALRTRLADLGVVDDAAREDPRAFRSSARQALQSIAPGLQSVRNDPALQELASDPEVQQALADGNALLLLQHPKLRGLIQRALTASSQDTATPETD
jgi:uncharacterized membrane protein required for colicin V production